jgi:hypothetical protein
MNGRKNEKYLSRFMEQGIGNVKTSSHEEDGDSSDEGVQG